MSNRALLLLCVILSSGCTPPSSGPEQSELTRQFVRVTREVPAFGGVTRASLRKAMIEASMRDEVAYMNAFREPEASVR